MKSFLCFFLKYDYGLSERGDSLEKMYFWPAIKEYSPLSEVIWLEEIGFLKKNRSELQKNIIEISKASNSDCAFFILMNDEVKMETLQELKLLGINTINWFSDDYWRFDNWSLQVSKYIKFAITTDKFSISKYNKLSQCIPILSNWGSFKTFSNSIDIIGQCFDYEVSFVGGKNPSREWYVEYLTQNGVRVECFGDGWKNGRVSEKEMHEVFLKSRINLNLSNSESTDFRYFLFLIKKTLISIFKLELRYYKMYKKHILQFLLRKHKIYESVKARNFEISSQGGLQLSHYALELEDFFSIGKDILVYSTLEDLFRQVKYILDNPNLAQSIRLNGFHKASSQPFNKKISMILTKINKYLD